MNTRWIKRIDGYLIPPPINCHCLIVVIENENDSSSLYSINTIYDGDYVSINDFIGEIIPEDQVFAYFVYDYKGLLDG